MSDSDCVSSCKVKTYYCYIISNDDDRTYNGYTVNLSNRLRQHNNEITGGARATRKRGPWKYLVVITSPCWESISTAMQHEWSIKYPTRRRPRPKEFNGKAGRLKSLSLIFHHMRKLNCKDILCYVHADYYDMMCEMCKEFADMVKVEAI